MEADTSDTLAAIQNQTSSSIVSTLLELQKHGIFYKRSVDWVENLEVLYLRNPRPSRKRRRDGEMVASRSEKKLLERANINACDPSKHYVALSYTWEPYNQASSHDAYVVQSRDGVFSGASGVRDQVFDRVIAYVNYLKKAAKVWVRGFWIDQECINQTDGAEKQLAMQSMEQVYTCSNFPVALLSVRMESEDHLNFLIYILKRKDRSRDQGPGPLRLLELLENITSDPWWTRAWTFQEDYCASTNMVLLIPHTSSLKKLKERNREVIGNLEGELCVESVRFRKQATGFCMDYRGDSHFEARCRKILDRAGKYNIQLLEPDDKGIPTIRQSMSPTIFSNVGKRGISVESDRLAVISNCLNYPVRLDTRKMGRRKFSLSIAMLAIFLLNGEILMNGPGKNRGAVESNIFDYLREQSLRTFQPPDIEQKLSFIKQCRFPGVKLSELGILTSGHLWRLSKIVGHVRATSPPNEGSPGCTLSGHEKMRLGQLAEHLSSGDDGSSYQDIACDIEKYLGQDEDWGTSNVTFAKQYKDWMASEVVKAMDNRRPLRLGSLISGKDLKSTSTQHPYKGIFISEADCTWTKEASYVFTAAFAGENRLDGEDKHVSLEVELRDSTRDSRARLVIKRWINGLFFFNRESPISRVVFPWPESLLV